MSPFDHPLLTGTDREPAFAPRIFPQHLLIAHRTRVCPAPVRLLQKQPPPPCSVVFKAPSRVLPPHPPVATTSFASSFPGACAVSTSSSTRLCCLGCFLLCHLVHRVLHPLVRRVVDRRSGVSSPGDISSEVNDRLNQRIHLPRIPAVPIGRSCFESDIGRSEGKADPKIEWK
jgi:hypothetical protein